jgi:site-specific DNA-methyltransferase (adenine-specific)
MNDYINITCEDNMELMARYPDNYFDLAIVDPPYGINMDGGNVGYKGFNNFKKKDWDKCAPTQEYFTLLQEKSKNQIIFGANHFIDNMPFNASSPCWLFWDKGEGFYNRTYAECEMAWTSFKKPARKIKYDPLANGDYRGKIHPTQKPVTLYQWILTNYAKPGDKILDTHIGSGSIAIAVDSVNKIEKMNLTLTGCELDPEYYAKAMERISAKTSQKSLFSADL